MSTWVASFRYFETFPEMSGNIISMPTCRDNQFNYAILLFRSQLTFHFKDFPLIFALFCPFLTTCLIYCIFLVFQAEELRRYFGSVGAEISEDRSAKGIEDDLHKIIAVCDACFANRDADNVSEDDHCANIQQVLNGIVSMLALVAGEKSSENLILAFCEKLTKAPAENQVGITCLKV